MNVFELYQFHYSKIHNITKRIVKLKFIEAYEKGRPYSYVFNSISSWFKDEIDEKFTFRLIREYPKAYKIFINRKNYYAGDEDKIVKNILNDELADCFKGERSVLYRSFIVDIAVEGVLRDIQNHFSYYNNDYYLLYSTGKFDEISLKDYEQPKTPQKKLVIKNPNKNREITKEDIIGSFTDDERMLIISIFYDLISKNNTSEIQLTGLIKLVKIIGAYEDLSIFKKKPSELTMYKKAQNGFGYYDSKMGVIKLIDSTLLKLESFDLKFISERLSIQRVKLTNELNKK